jgi:MoaA/NifB/PqqE/SkfB family radical SAM enzyme
MNNNKKNIRYGFYDRLNKNFPSQILIDVAETCNLECIHCPHPDFKKSHNFTNAFLDIELHNKLIDEVSLNGKGITQYIRYASNGEPLIHPRIYDMIDYGKKKSGVPITLTTNGVTMTKKRIHRLIDAGVDVIDISIDAFSNEVYEKVRVGGDLNVTRKNVLDLIEEIRLKDRKTKVVVSFVENELNTHEVSLFEKFWKDSGASYVVIRRMHSCSGAKIEFAALRRQNNKLKDRTPCLYPWERIVLTPTGELAFCPSDWVFGSNICSYKETTIKELWQSKFYEELRQAHLTNDFKNHNFCDQCPDWESTRWPDEGRSYADMMSEFEY